jgi:hypothetical protein
MNRVTLFFAFRGLFVGPDPRSKASGVIPIICLLVPNPMNPHGYLPKTYESLNSDMMQAESLAAGRECADCRTLAPIGVAYCGACGCKDFRDRQQPRFPTSALAAFVLLGVIPTILYWFGR